MPENINSNISVFSRPLKIGVLSPNAYRSKKEYKPFLQ